MDKNETPNILPAPESVIVCDEEDLYKKLDVGMEQIDSGNVIDADSVMLRLENKLLRK